MLRAYYSKPGRPLQFSCEKPGMICKFTLMTAGDARAPTGSTNGRIEPNSNPSVQQNTSSNLRQQRQSTLMAAPSRPEGRRNTQTLGRRGIRSNQPTGPPNQNESESLFVPLEEEDRGWDPTNYDEDENELAWDTREPNVMPLILYNFQ